MTRTAPLAAAAALLLLAACDSPAEDAASETYETDVVDESGGELIVRDADEPGAAVDPPETPMTNAPAGAETGATAADVETGETVPPNE